MYTAMLAARCEYQIRADWDLNPGLFSLSFASKVNLGLSLSLKRALRAGGVCAEADEDIDKAIVRLYGLVWHGEYKDASGRRTKVNGDLSKLPHLIGLSETQKAMLRSYQFMSRRLPGTRQIRNAIRHIIFSSRIYYGIPVFMTFTPSERHSGLAIRLHRGRTRDSAYSGSAHDLHAWIGSNTPTLCPEEFDSENSQPILIDLPEYNTRRRTTSRDPLCCVYAFYVMTHVVFPSLYGFRMCADCPHCAQSTNPCMDTFGSNATAMGGAAGRSDAMIGAVEAQKAEGVLHVHLFLYVQMITHSLGLCMN
jgi:hypothetical protein